MYNQLTDQYKIVQTEIVSALPFFGRMISAEENRSLVVFWCGEYIGSKTARNAPPAGMSGQKPIKKVKNGYVIYRVSSGNFSVPIDGSCTTKDQYMRTYMMALEFMVINPVLFAQGYHLRRDPLKMAVELTRYAFLNYVAQTNHDSLNGWLPGDQFFKNLADETGMTAKINTQKIQDDPKHVQPLAAGLAADINDLEILRAEIQELKDELEKTKEEQERTYLAGVTRNRMKERDKEFDFKQEIEQKKHDFEINELARKEEEAQHIHTINKQLLETAAKEMAQILQASMRDTFDSKESTTEVVKDLEKFMKELRGSLLNVTKEDVGDSSKSGSPTNGTSP